MHLNGVQKMHQEKSPGFFWICDAGIQFLWMAISDSSPTQVPKIVPPTRSPNETIVRLWFVVKGIDLREDETCLS